MKKQTMNLGTVHTTILDKINRALRTRLPPPQIKEGKSWRFGFRTGGFSPELVVAYESRTRSSLLETGTTSFPGSCPTRRLGGMSRRGPWERG